MQYSSAFEGID